MLELEDRGPLSLELVLELLQRARALLLLYRDGSGHKRREVLDGRRRERRSGDLFDVRDLPPAVRPIGGRIHRDAVAKIEEPRRTVAHFLDQRLKDPVELGTEPPRLRGGRARPVPTSAGDHLFGERAAEGETSGERAREVRPGTRELGLDLGRSYDPGVRP